MSGMFMGCRALTSLDLSKFDTSAVTSMSSMFGGARALTSLDLHLFDTSNVTRMGYMFYGTHALHSLNARNWNVANVTDSYGFLIDSFPGITLYCSQPSLFGNTCSP